ncbi:MAG: NAD-dependent epimerase [Geobacteraceae bacterium GWC2_48_7]|nr:MAG: NAD-dependent epimerase [Geobacteraceae bacterium GWB2_52_12]OGU00669.1 MAG: NAD-dependent epimerase [Geobacteraceae bacterium GWC2_48_7]
MTSLDGRQVLITGGLGFIGSNLAIRLVELGANVTLVDSLIPEYGGNLWNIEPIKDKVRVNISDVRDEHSMKYLLQGQDYLFNLAGQTSHVDSMNNPYPDLEINARAQLSILEACRKYNPAIQVVFASTRQLYGAPQYLPVDEKHPLAPVDVNGINKMAGEWYHLLYNNVYGIRAVVLRLTNTYGPRMRVKDARQTFLGIWIRNLLEDKPILVFGDGRQIRDFNYVDDVVEALLLCAVSEDANGEIFNLGADDPINLKDTAELLVKVAGYGRYELVPFPDDRKAIDIGDYYADYRKIRAKLGWKPSVHLEDGLMRTLAYYGNHATHYWETGSDI